VHAAPPVTACPAVNCELCPHRCAGISEGKAGICRYRRNEGGRLIAGNYGRVSSSGYDPIEKKTTLSLPAR